MQNPTPQEIIANRPPSGGGGGSGGGGLQPCYSPGEPQLNWISHDTPSFPYQQLNQQQQQQQQQTTLNPGPYQNVQYPRPTILRQTNQSIRFLRVLPNQGMYGQSLAPTPPGHVPLSPNPIFSPPPTVQSGPTVHHQSYQQQSYQQPPSPGNYQQQPQQQPHQHQQEPQQHHQQQQQQQQQHIQQHQQQPQQQQQQQQHHLTQPQHQQNHVHQSYQQQSVIQQIPTQQLQYSASAVYQLSYNNQPIRIQPTYSSPQPATQTNNQQQAYFNNNSGQTNTRTQSVPSQQTRTPSSRSGGPRRTYNRRNVDSCLGALLNSTNTPASNIPPQAEDQTRNTIEVPYTPRHPRHADNGPAKTCLNPPASLPQNSTSACYNANNVSTANQIPSAHTQTTASSNQPQPAHLVANPPPIDPSCGQCISNAHNSSTRTSSASSIPSTAGSAGPVPRPAHVSNIRATTVGQPTVLIAPQSSVVHTPVSVSSTTRIQAHHPRVAAHVQATVEMANKACQFVSDTKLQEDQSVDATVATRDMECQTDEPSSIPATEKTFVDRACSPIIFTQTHDVPTVRRKITAKRKLARHSPSPEQQSLSPSPPPPPPKSQLASAETNGHVSSDSEIDVIE